MKLLFNQNLSHRLPGRIADLFPDSEHVRTAGLDRVPDDQIWQHAFLNDYTIVTQDADFAERSRLHGAPPKVIWLRCGNTTPREIERILRESADAARFLLTSTEVHCLELFG